MVEGKLIEKIDPQPEVRKNAETASDWEYRDEAQYLYSMAVVFKDRLLDPILLTDRRRLPEPVISFADMRNYNTLAAYKLIRNPQGLLYEITMNTQHYEKKEDKVEWSFGRWAQMETLLHEMVHLKQQNFGADPVVIGKRSTYHNKEFVEMCEAVGLHPKLGEGWHVRLATDPFAKLMSEYGIETPQELDKGIEFDIDWFKFLLDDGKKKGRSTLNKWVCPKCNLKVRIGIKGNPELLHQPCGSVLIRADSGTVFEAKK